MATALPSSENHVGRATFCAAARFRTARLLAAATALWVTPHAMGQFTVTNLNDTGAGSLRDVLAGAGAGATIDFDSGLSGSVNLTSQITINQGVTINGPGITINGGGATRLFFVNAGSGQAVELNGLTLTDGNAQGGRGGDGFEGGGGGGLGAGGAVFAQSGNLTLTNISLTNNQANGGSGGNGSLVADLPGGGGGGGGLGGNGGMGAEADGSNQQLRSTGGGGGGVTETGQNGGTSGLTPGGFVNADPGLGGGSGGDGAAPTPPTDAQGGGFGGGGGGGASDQDELNNNASFFSGGDGGFGGGGGGSSSNINFDDGGADGGAGGFGAGGGGASGSFSSFEGGDGGLGGGSGGGNGTGTGAGSGGGGSGIGGAVFLADGATLTVTQTTATTVAGNSISGGAGGVQGAGIFGGPGEPGQPGQTVGAVLFGQGTASLLNINLDDGITQTLDAAQLADETALTDASGAAGTGTLGLTKTGLGTLNLTGSAGFSGAVNVNQGRLGNGAGAADTLTLSGDLNVGANGELNVAFDGSSIDQFVVNGTANLGGTVNFIELASGATTDTPRTFLTADTINGTFAATNTVFLSGSSLSSAAVSFTNNGTSDLAQVTFGAFTATFGTQGLTNSGAGAGGALDTLAVNQPGASVPIINAVNASTNPSAALESQGNIIDNASAAEVNTAFAQVTHTARTRISINALSQATAASSRLASASGGTRVDDTAVDPAAFSLPQAPHDGAVGWAQLIGGFSTIEGDSLGLGSDATTYGATLGVEWGGHALGNPNLLGVFLGYTQTQTDVDLTNDEGEADNIQLGAYLSRDFDEQLHFNAIGSVSYIHFETERFTSLGVAEGDFDGVGFQGSLELLYDLNRDDQTIISPYVGAEGSLVLRNGYNESGAGALNLTVDDETDEYITTLLGVQAAGQFDFEDRPGRGLRVVAGARAAWGYQLLDTNASTTSAFTVASANRFTTSGPERDRSSFRGGINLELIPLGHRDWNIFAQYIVDFNADAQDHILQAGVRFAF